MEMKASDADGLELRRRKDEVMVISRAFLFRNRISCSADEAPVVTPRDAGRQGSEGRAAEMLRSYVPS